MDYQDFLYVLASVKIVDSKFGKYRKVWYICSMKQEKLQYLAGIFDSEGYVRIRKTKSGNNFCYTPEVKIYMTNKNIVNLFSTRYNVPIKQDFRGNHRKLVYHITFGVGLLKSTTFISDLLPYLNEKRLQLEQIQFLLNGTNKEQCYQRYMLSKTNFNHIIKDEPSYAYLAGIIDGDGWISMFKKGGNALLNSYTVGLQQRYKPMIDYMTKFGGSSTHKCKIYDYQSHVQTYSWQNTTSNILILLLAIEPYLIEKQEKCKIMIEYINKLEQFKKYSEEVLVGFRLDK